MMCIHIIVIEIFCDSLNVDRCNFLELSNEPHSHCFLECTVIALNITLALSLLISNPLTLLKWCSSPDYKHFKVCTK